MSQSSRIIGSLKVLMKPSRKFCSSQAVTDSIVYTPHTKFVTEILLNKPKALNAVDMKMVKSLLKNCRSWLPDDNSDTGSDSLKPTNENKTDSATIPKVVIMSGAGGKAFCAGGDVVSIYNLRKQNKPNEEVCEFFKWEYLADFTIAKMKPIQVSIWNGFVMGGGVGVSINSPIRIATENTVFAMPETKIGLIPDVGATYFLPRIFNNNASVGLFYGLTGERLKGKDLVKCGLATHFVAPDKIEELKKKILETTDDNITLQKLHELCSSYSEIIYRDKDFSVNKLEEINSIFKLDSLNGIFTRLHTFAESGDDSQKEWANNIIKNLLSYSPNSLHLHLEQMKRSQKMRTLEEAYELELKVVSNILKGNEFTEGVRALLIEKDNKPKWEFPSYKEVNEKELIIHHFGN